jgi:putative ABC transport system permease protein
MKVTGVFQDLPHNTHLSFDMAISAATLENSISNIRITNGGPFCYLKLEHGVNTGDFEKKVKAFSHEHFTRLLKSTCATCDAEAYLQPLSELPFNSGVWFDTAKTKSRYLLIALSTIAVLILMMAWINYVNMAVTANLKRVKELAARKTVGARYSDFIIQFVWEAFIVNLVAAVLAFVIIQTMRAPAEALLQFYIPDLMDTSPTTLIIVLATLTFGTLFTGIYPAIITLRANPRVLFGTFKALRKGNAFTNVLTTLQFSFAVILITWIFSIHLQLDYILNKDLGIRQDQIVTIDLPMVYTQVSDGTLHAFSEEVSKVPGVMDRTVSHSIPGLESKFIGVERNGKWITAQSNGAVDENFIPLYHIQMIAGRNFQQDNAADQQSILLSKTATEQLGIDNPTEAIGQSVSVQKTDWSPESSKATIIGVFEDYKVDPLFSSINNKDGIVLVYKNYLVPENIAPRKISLLVNAADISGTLHQVEALYSATFADQVFNWNFLDQQIGRFYDQEKTTRNQITFFTLLAVGIACLGLLGIIRNKAIEKTKEMGVRKVLGAEFHHLSAILLNNTARQVLIATVLGIPAAVFLTQRYLEKFSDRITLQWWHYAIPAVILVAVMLATVASTLFKVNKTNPVDALRYE